MHFVWGFCVSTFTVGGLIGGIALFMQEYNAAAAFFAYAVWTRLLWEMIK